MEQEVDREFRERMKALDTATADLDVMIEQHKFPALSALALTDGDDGADAPEGAQNAEKSSEAKIPEFLLEN